MDNAFVLLEQDQFTFLLYNPEQVHGFHDFFHHEGMNGDAYFVDGYAYRARFVGANSKARLASGLPEPHYYNYFIGNEPAKWASGIHPSREVLYHGLYPHIDLKVYSSDHRFKYDWIIHPGGDPSDIAIAYEGTEGISVVDGKLLIKAGFTEVIELEPYAWQEVQGKQSEVECRYVIDGATVRLLVEDYDRSRPLVIDPVMIVSTYSGSGFDIWGCTATYDAAGSLYTAGTCFESGINGYPVTTGAFQVNFGGGITDAAISKYDPTGSTLIYATYLGGTASTSLGYDMPQSMMVNTNDQLVVMGATGSTNFPTMNAYDNTFNGGGWDIFVTAFNSTGTALVGSTYVGGTQADGISQIGYNTTSDHTRSEIILDGLNNIYVASSTTSSNFPVTPAAFQSSLSGTSDAIVLKLSPNTSSLIWSTYLGSPGDDAAYSIRIDDANSVYVVGGTDTSGFPTTAGAHVTSYRGGINDGFVVHLNNLGTALLASTLSGTTSYDQVFMVDIDNNGGIWILGQSEGTYPVSPGAYANAFGNIFIQKLDTDLSTVQLSTIIGGGAPNVPEIVPTAFMVDQCGSIYFAGYQDYNTYEPLPISAGAFQPTPAGNDFYFATLDPNLGGLDFSTYWGSGAFDHVDAGPSRYDPVGNIYQAVCSPSPAYPTTANAFSPTDQNDSYDCIGIKIDFQQAAVTAAIIPSVTLGCSPLQVSFQNNSTGASQYQWSFGDGSTDNGTTPTHTFTSTGTYTVTLIASNPASCNGADTAMTVIQVVADPIAAFSVSPTNIGLPGQVFGLTDLSTGATQWEWTFGDGTSSSIQNPQVSYSQVGTYDICLQAISPGGCEDTVCQKVTVLTEVNGAIQIPTAFTPNGDGINDRFQVTAENVMEMHLMIFNRWGDKVFETGDQAQGWDGTFNGLQQGIQVFAYIAVGKFADGSDFSYCGNVTLLK